MSLAGFLSDAEKASGTRENVKAFPLYSLDRGANIEAELTVAGLHSANLHPEAPVAGLGQVGGILIACRSTAGHYAFAIDVQTAWHLRMSYDYPGTARVNITQENGNLAPI